MKHYKFLVPIILIVLFGFSIYTLIDVKTTLKDEYNRLLSQARHYTANEAYSDALVCYKSALDKMASSELYDEIGQFYIKSGQPDEALDWYKESLDLYPDRIKLYEALMKIYVDTKDYVDCFNLYDLFQKKKLDSPKVAKMISSVEYQYYTDYEYEDVGIYSAGYCAVKLNGKWGYVNLTGGVRTRFLYETAGAFASDLAPVIDKDNKPYYIDPHGNRKIVVENLDKVEEYGFIENNVTTAKVSGKWALYNNKGKILSDQYENITSIGNGLVGVKTKSGWTLLDQSGKETSKKSFEKFVADEKGIIYRNQRLFAYYDLNYHLIDSSGKEVGSEKYEDAHLFNDATLAAVKQSGNWGFVNNEGKMKIEPEYEDARSFSNGLAAVKMDGKWGFINEKNQMVIKPSFEDAKDFNSSGCVFVKDEESWLLLCLYKNNH